MTTISHIKDCGQTIVDPSIPYWKKEFRVCIPSPFSPITRSINRQQPPTTTTPRPLSHPSLFCVHFLAFLCVCAPAPFSPLFAVWLAFLSVWWNISWNLPLLPASVSLLSCLKTNLSCDMVAFSVLSATNPIDWSGFLPGRSVCFFLFATILFIDRGYNLKGDTVLFLCVFLHEPPCIWSKFSGCVVGLSCSRFVALASFGLL